MLVILILEGLAVTGNGKIKTDYRSEWLKENGRQDNWRNVRN